MRSSSLISFLLLLFFVSCVSTKKYDEMRLAKEYWEQEADSVDSLRQELLRIEEDVQESNLQLSDSYYDLEQLEATNRNLQRNYQDILRRYNKIVDQSNRVIGASSMERMGLTEELADKQQMLDQKERELGELEYMLEQRERRLGFAQDDLGSMQEEIIDRERRISELSALLDQQESRMGNLQNSINSDFSDFGTNELNISGRDGKVFLELSENLLFSSGSKTVGSRGRQALRRIAETLNNSNNRDLGIIVEGHTDSDGSANTNWDLSVQRSTAVVKELVKNGVKPERITAAGRGLYDPSVPNTNRRNKAKNRRVEIILSPDYDAMLLGARN
ncbi:MAG: OmpA family protein [Bacteroidota bacterium]